MVYPSWKDEVLVTLPKVEGSAHLDDVRPIGLLSSHIKEAVRGCRTAVADDDDGKGDIPVAGAAE